VSLFFSDALRRRVLTEIDHPHWVGEEISQILELDRMFDRDDCPEHRHRDDRGFDVSEFSSRYKIYNRSGLTRWQILQFTTHILDTQSVDHIRYRNRTRLKYHFHAINIAKELARLLDGTSGTTAVSGMSAPSVTSWIMLTLTSLSMRKQPVTRSSTPFRSS
jgi:hypothetical protein